MIGNIFVRILNKIQVLQYFNFVFSVTINKTSFKIPVIRTLGKDNLQISEIWMCHLLQKLLKIKKGSFLDVGMNVGQTLIKLKSVDANLNYFGFEPNPVCIFYVQQLIKVNKFENTTLYPVGIAERTQLLELNFFTNSSTDSSASVLPDFRPFLKILHREIIPCFQYRDINQDRLQDISIVKIDVEGAELEVLKGLKSLLQAQRPFIVIEILPVYKKENVNRLERQFEIEKLIIALDYSLLRINKTSDNHFEHLEFIDTIGIHAQIEWSDYLFCPSEFLDAVLPLASTDTSRIK